MIISKLHQELIDTVASARKKIKEENLKKPLPKRGKNMSWEAFNITTGETFYGASRESVINKVKKSIGYKSGSWHRDYGISQITDDSHLEYGQFSESDNRIRISNY